MAINFPTTSLTPNVTTYTYSGRTWLWTGTVWQSVGTAQGLQGTQGIQGIQGSQGTQGVQGIQGIQGSSYTGPTLGQTYLSSAQTISGVQGLTLQNTTLQGTLIAGGVVGTSGYLLTSTGTGVQWAPAPVSLPSQTGYALQFLTTNGTTASWTPVYYQSVATAATTGVAGTPSTARPKLTFIGATLSDDSANNQTTVTITSGGNAEINTIMGVY